MRWSSGALLGIVLAVLPGCTLGRWYVGSPIQANPAEALTIGTTARAEVLARFGPPDRILRERSGDVFIYRYDQRNTSELDISDPFQGITIFHWGKNQDKSDHLMVFFDRDGVVSSYGYRRGRNELEPL